MKVLCKMLISRQLVCSWGSLCLCTLVVSIIVPLCTNKANFLDVLLLGYMHSVGVDVGL